jgi:hypothetical protein
MAKQVDELAEWMGQELLDAGGHKIGMIAGLGYPRRKFGTAWLLVETAAEKKVLVPADQISSSDNRLVLPYPKTYVEDAPALEQNEPLSRAQERRLCLHYGLESQLPNSGCSRGCGLCMAQRRAERSHKE